MDEAPAQGAVPAGLIRPAAGVIDQKWPGPSRANGDFVTLLRKIFFDLIRLAQVCTKYFKWSGMSIC